MSQIKVEKYFSWLLKYRHQANLCFLIITLVSLALSFRLSLKTDFSKLLPDKLGSVQSLRKISDRVGGTGLLFVGIESKDFEVNKRFSERLREKLEPMIGHEIKYIEYRYEDVSEYLKKYGLHYLSLEQLDKLKADLNEQLESEKDSKLGLGISSSSSELAAKKENWLNEVDPRFRPYFSFRESYLSGENGQFLVMLIRPNASALGIDKVRSLISAVQTRVDELKPESFGLDLKIHLGGGLHSTLREVETIKKDILDTALLLTFLILLVLLIFFRSIQSVFFLCAHLAVAIIWTFGFTKLSIGYLNSQTAFLASIVVGTGINYGIILLARYKELATIHKNTEEAMLKAIESTWLSTLIACISTALGFAALLLANNQGLSHFGIIGGVGVIFCWIAAYSCLPLWIVQSRRLNILQITPRRENELLLLIEKGGNILASRPGWVMSSVLLVTLFMSFGIYRLARNPFEYNFDNLLNRVTYDPQFSSVKERMEKIVGSPVISAIFATESTEDADQVCEAVRAKDEARPQTLKIVKSCVSLSEVLPQNLDRQKPAEAQIRDEKIKSIYALLNSKEFKNSTSVREIATKLSLSPPKASDLPEQILRRFREKDGSVGKIAFVDANKTLNDGRNLLNFTSLLSEVKLKNEKLVSASGDSFVFADLLRSLQIDAPRIALASFILVALTAFFLTGHLMQGVAIAACLFLGIFWMIGVQGFFGLKYNFFNFIALPLSCGIGVDYAVNLFGRMKEEGYERYGSVLRSSGVAVALCSLTTLIGYYTLVDSASRALAGFAKLAIMGELTCLTVAVVALPAFIFYFSDSKNLSTKKDTKTASKEPTKISRI